MAQQELLSRLKPHTRHPPRVLAQVVLSGTEDRFYVDRASSSRSAVLTKPSILCGLSARVVARILELEKCLLQDRTK